MNETWILKDYRPLHSEFQIRFLILARSGGTLYGCYKQSLREIATRLNGLLQSSLQSNGITQIRKHQFLVELDQKCIEDSIRELSVFYAYAQSIKTMLGDLSNARISVLEEDYWVHQLRTSIARDYLASGRLTEQTIELLHLMPQVLRRTIIDSLTCPTARDALINWYLNYELPIPSVSDDCIADAVRQISVYVYGYLRCDFESHAKCRTQIESSDH